MGSDWWERARLPVDRIARPAEPTSDAHAHHLKWIERTLPEALFLCRRGAGSCRFVLSETPARAKSSPQRAFFRPRSLDEELTDPEWAESLRGNQVLFANSTHRLTTSSTTAAT